MWLEIRKDLDRATLKSLRYISDIEKHQKGMFVYELSRPEKNATIRLYIYLPSDINQCKKLLFSVHGYKGNASSYRDIWVNEAEKNNIIVVAPQFKESGLGMLPPFSLKTGNMWRGTRKSALKPREEWAFIYLTEIFDYFKNHFPSIESYSVFGHSAGAQFAHRFAIFHDDERVDNIIAANAGWYTLLDQEMGFPYGVKGVLSKKEAESVLSKKLVILVGAEDSGHKYLRMTKRAIMQGASRLERANTAYDVAQKLASLLDVDFSWKFKIVHNTGHERAAMAKEASKYL